MDNPCPIIPLASIDSRQLLASMKRLAAAERVLSVYALVQLGEIWRRKVYEDEGYPSMFAYCVGELRYSEATAYRRLEAASAASKFPEILTMIRDGGLTICALSTIARHLTMDNRAELLGRLEGKSTRAALRLAAELKPLPDTRDSVRAVSSAIAAVNPPVHAEPPVSPPEAPVISSETPQADAVTRPAFPAQRIIPRSGNRVHFSFTGSEELRKAVDRCADLLWHKHPSGRLEDVLLEVANDYLTRKDPGLLPHPKARPPRTAETRAAPRWVRSIVYRRDEGRCVFRSAEGRRCGARRGLEYDHIKPWSKGGRSDDPSNIRLLCRAHNQWAARAEGLA